MVQKVIQQGLPLRWEADATDERLHQLYSCSLFTVYPSLVEGFGLQWRRAWVLERPASAVARCDREIAGSGGCLLVDTGDWLGLARVCCLWLSMMKVASD